MSTSSTTTGLLSNYRIQSNSNLIFEGMIHKDSSGNFTLKVKKNDSGNTDSKITTASKFLLIKIK